MAIAIVAEARDDAAIGSGLADRVIVDAVEWIEIETLEHHRRWRGIRESEPFSSWVAVRIAGRTHGDLVPKSHGKFDSGPAELGARAARRALLVLVKCDPQPSGVVLLSDVGNRGPDVLAGLEQARSDWPWPFPIAVGACDRERECWVLNGFEARDERERASLDDVRRELGFDPTIDGHRLTAGNRDAKRVLALLVSNDDREEACWRDTRLNVLASRGSRTGLATYLGEVRSRLVPLFTTWSRGRDRSMPWT